MRFMRLRLAERSAARPVATRSGPGLPLSRATRSSAHPGAVGRAALAFASWRASSARGGRWASPPRGSCWSAGCGMRADFGRVHVVGVCVVACTGPERALSCLRFSLLQPLPCGLACLRR
eukprot:2629915-Lingulodinium_polyedra.AAC.1